MHDVKECLKVERVGEVACVQKWQFRSDLWASILVFSLFRNRLCTHFSSPLFYTFFWLILCRCLLQHGEGIFAQLQNLIYAQVLILPRCFVHAFRKNLPQPGWVD